MVYYWSSFLGATCNEPDADFTWTSCLYCGTRGAKVIMRDHEQVCEKRPVCCVYQSNGCPFQGHAEDHRRHLVYCQFKEWINELAESCSERQLIQKNSRALQQKTVSVASRKLMGFILTLIPVRWRALLIKQSVVGMWKSALIAKTAFVKTIQ